MMPAVPLPFVIALLLIILLIRLIRRNRDEPTDRAAMIFIGACAIMVTVVGLRWSFDLRIARLTQPIVAATLPAIAWLCFAGLAGTGARKSWRRWLHALPACLVALMPAYWPSGTPPIDFVLAALFFGYGFALLRLGSGGPDALAAARLVDAAGAHKAIIIAGIVLVGSGLTDLLIASDFGFYQGAHAASIVVVANLATLALLAFAVAVAGRSLPAADAGDAVPENTVRQAPPVGASEPPGPSLGPDDQRVVDVFDRMMKEKRLFRDPDLTLNRLARRAGIPARQISATINRVHGRNVSQVVNEYRVEEAKRLLRQRELSITAIMFECGFQTKSNFNREFLRVTGMSPSDYRRSGDNREPDGGATLTEALPPERR